ncbi:MAG: hypothetical protein IKT40_09420 [Bacilli bacterium]|nr:hypothetical protein [Bacilli bacterium]
MKRIEKYKNLNIFLDNLNVILLRKYKNGDGGKVFLKRTLIGEINIPGQPHPPKGGCLNKRINSFYLAR